MLGELDFKSIESKLSARWDELALYKFDDADEKREVYSIDSPPPFTSGALHMGHMLSYSYFDFAARYKRMQGYNVFYPQGWDCQGFPTEIKVEQKYGRNLPRAEFLQRAREFTLQNIAAMKGQMRQMGFSPDWRFEYRTMDPEYHRKVQYSLLKMREKDLVYRAKHPVLFCTHCRSAIAKAETEEVEADSLFNTISFTVEQTGEELLIATTRPELLHACAAVFVHPEDERAKTLAGKHARTPVFNKLVPIIADADVQKDFGTGIVMVCSFGDKDDVQWIYRHKLPITESWTDGGKVINAGPGFDGLSIAAMRERVLEELKAQGKLLKQEKIRHAVKTHDRCKKPVDFLATMQWFIKIKGSEKQVVGAAKEMQWIPEFSIQYLIDWAEFIEYDWVISRARVYGTPIPFYVCEKCGKEYAPEYSKLPVDPAHDAAGKECACGGNLVGETATCDCWVDSSITPLAIGGWPDNNALLAKTYPATLRPQGLEIIRTWAFYTIARCTALTGKPPFKQVLINGSVLGKDGKKMSKSLGNYEDPNLLLQKYSADALRQWAALSGAFARDRPFSYKDVDHAQSFLKKLWNASKFAQKLLDGYEHSSERPAGLRATDKWLLGRVHKLVKACTQAMNGYDYYTCITAIQQFFWHEFCDYYLEEIKYRTYGTDEESKRAAQYCVYAALNSTLKLLAPFACFTSDEIYCELFAGREKTKSVHACSWPAYEEEYINPPEENIVDVLHQLLGEVRKFKAGKAMALNEPLAFAGVVLPDTLLKDFTLVEEELKSVGKIGELGLSAGEEIKVELRV